MNLTLPRPSTILLLGLLLALLVSSPVPLAVTVAVTVWALHSPAALVVGIALTAAWRVTHPKAVR